MSSTAEAAQHLGPDGMHVFRMGLRCWKGGDAASATEHTFLVVQALGMGPTVEELIDTGARKFGMKLLPWTSVAVDLSAQVLRTSLLALQ